MNKYYASLERERRYRAENPRQLSRSRAHSRARTEATRELIARHRDEFDDLHQKAKQREGLT